MLQELEIHQTELALQNEHLARVCGDAERASARYRDFFDCAPVPYLIVSQHGIIERINSAAAAMLGGERASLCGRNLASFVATDASRHELLDGFARLVCGFSEHTTCDFQMTTSRRTFFASLDATIVRRGTETILVVLKDVTDRKHIEDALRGANRRKDEFLAVLSHELRNPLTPIMTSLFVLEGRNIDGDGAHQALQIVRRQIVHLSHLVDRLLDVTRLERGKLDVDFASVDLRRIVAHAIEDHQAAFSGKGIVLRSFLCEHPVFVQGDETRLNQILGNLLGNALKFTPPGKQVEVRLETDGDAKLAIKDSGRGIPKNLLAHVFEPFVQAHQVNDSRQGGLGLGLALVKGLVELHGGCVSVESAGLGEGTTVLISIPLTEQPKGALDVESGHKEKARGQVLVIEDNPDTAESLKQVLEFFDQQVVVAHDGPSGVSAAHTLCPELVICDLGLPGMDGYHVAEAIRADGRLSHTQLVALSGYTLPQDVNRALQAGFDKHLSKPASVEQLEKLIPAPSSRPSCA